MQHKPGNVNFINSRWRIGRGEKRFKKKKKEKKVIPTYIMTIWKEAKNTHTSITLCGNKGAPQILNLPLFLSQCTYNSQSHSSMLLHDKLPDSMWSGPRPNLIGPHLMN